MAYVNKAMILTFIILLCGVSMADQVYEVGDSAGWTANDHVDYKSWAAKKQFHVGDIIVFRYNQFHNVLRVTHQHFRDCNSTSPIATYATGNDSFKLRRRSRHLYFICGVPGHCEAGQKVDIRVVDPTSVASPSPTGSHPSLPRSPALELNASQKHNVGSSVNSSWKLWAFAVVMALAY